VEILAKARDAAARLLVGAAVLGLGLPGTAAARCTQPSELSALRVAVRVGLNCAQRRISDGPQALCSIPAGPACADGAVATLVELLAGPPPATGLQRGGFGAQLRCQRSIGVQGANFLRVRITERLHGSRRQMKSARVLDRLANRCVMAVAADALGTSVPRVGGDCAVYTSTPGQPLDVHSLTRCLRPSLEAVLSDVLGPLPPSVLVVMTDDQRWDQMEVVPSVTSRVAGRGVDFRQSFVTTSLCCPSRASFLTGRYAHNHGVLGNTPPLGGAPLFNATSTLPVWLRSAGYRTALFGKYMNAYASLGPVVPPGWDVWQAFLTETAYFNYFMSDGGTLAAFGNAPEDYATDVIRDRALAFIDASANHPFFAVWAPCAPHEPAVPAPRHAGLFAGIPPARPPNFLEPDVSLKPAYVQFQKAIFQPAVGIAKADALRQGMLESLLAVDEAVEAFLDRLEQLGLTDNTLVVYTSDNGLHLLEHWWPFKVTAYEEAMRVPLAIRYPVLTPAPRTVDALVTNIDLAPTIASLAGVTIPSPVDGQSLVPLLAGTPTVWREDVLCENFSGLLIPPIYAVRTARWKYINTDAASGVTQELYDLEADPYELVNLAFNPAYADLRTALAARLAVLRAQ
jgi:arylsulfatase A-like enzyme